MSIYQALHCYVNYVNYDKVHAKRRSRWHGYNNFYARRRATHSHFASTLITNIYRIVMAHRVYHDTVKCIHSDSTASTAINSFLFRHFRLILYMHNYKNNYKLFLLDWLQWDLKKARFQNYIFSLISSHLSIPCQIATSDVMQTERKKTSRYCQTIVLQSI